MTTMLGWSAATAVEEHAIAGSDTANIEMQYSHECKQRFMDPHPRPSPKGRGRLERRIFAKDHAAGGGLQDAGDVDLDLFADVIAASFDHDHGAVVEVADALPHFF